MRGRLLMTRFSSWMAVCRCRPSCRQELNARVHLAIATPAPKIPASHLAKLAPAGHVVTGPDGPRVAGDGMVRIAESG